MKCLRASWGVNNLRRCSEEQLIFLGGARSSGSCRLRNRTSCVGSKVSGRLRIVAATKAAADGLMANSKSDSFMFDVSNTPEEEAVSGKFDEWIRDCVEEIVSKIEEAPFLVQIYPEDEEEGSSRRRMATEKGWADSWNIIKSRWEGGGSIPNGIALVQELNNNNALLNLPTTSQQNVENEQQQQTCSSTKVFGIVVQERGVGCPACYILKTTRVRSLSGICTHFCIFRVECFAESADMQLNKLWIL